MAQQRTTNRGVLFALIAGVMIYGLAMGTTYPLLGIVLSQEVTGTWNGMNAAATGIGLITGVLIVPFASRHLGSGSTALVGVIVMAISLATLAIVDEFWTIFAARTLLGCGANLLFVVSETALNVFAPPVHRGRVMGIYTAAVAFGFVVGPVIVSVTPGEPALLLLVCAAVTVVAILPLQLARTPVDRLVRPTSLTRMLPTAIAFPFAFGFLFVASAIDAVVISLLPVIALHQSYTIEAGALLVAVFHVGLLVGQPMIGVSLDHLGRRRTVLGCCLASLCCVLMLVFGARFDFWSTACIMFVWGGANYGLYTAGLALIGDRFSGETLTAATATFAAVYAIASLMSPTLAGVAVDRAGASGFYIIVAAIYLIALFYAAIAFRPLEPTLSLH